MTELTREEKSLWPRGVLFEGVLGTMHHGGKEHVVLTVEKGMISLTDPTISWEIEAGPDGLITKEPLMHLLAPGESVTLTQGEAMIAVCE